MSAVELGMVGRALSALTVGEGAATPILTLGSAFVAAALGMAALLLALQRQLRLYRHRFTAGIGAGLQQAFVFVDTRRLFRLNLVAVALLGSVTLAVTTQPLAALVIVVITGAAPATAVKLLKRLRQRQFAQQFPDALMLVAGGLRAGSSLPQAIALAAREMPPPAAQELGLVMREQKLGLTIDGSMANLERRMPLAEVCLFAAAVRIAQESGGNLAESLERLSETVRRKLAVEGKIDALTAQGRLQGWVMALLPIGIAAALFAIEPIAMRPLIATWYGWLVCATVLVLELVGLHFIRRIVRIDV